MSNATLASIMRDINTTLREATGLRVYGNEVKEGFKRPCLFVQLLPIHDQIESVHLERRLIMVSIQYFSEHGTDVENLAMADKLRETFGLIVNVGGRKLTRGEARTDTVDGVLQFRFDLAFYDTPAQAAELEPVDLMQELIIGGILMGLPSIEIIFKTLGITAIRRSSRGIVALILEDATHASVTNPIVMRGVNDIPKTLSADNQEQIEFAFRGGVNPPKKVMAYVIAPAGEGAADYGDAQDYLETAQWDYLAVPQIATGKVNTMATWVKGLRDNKARKVKAVLPNCRGDHEGIINFTTDNIVVGKKLYNTAQYCARIAGILAGNPLTISSTFQVLPGVDDVPHLTRDEFDTAIDAGELVLMHDGEKVKIARGVNSLTSFTADKGAEFSKIKLVDIMDLIHRDITRTAEDYYIGKMPNDYNHKILLVTAINAYLEALENEGLLDRGKNWVDVDAEAHRLYLEGRGLDTEGLNEQQLRQANTGAHVFLTGNAKPLDAMEDFKIKIFI